MLDFQVQVIWLLLNLCMLGSSGFGEPLPLDSYSLISPVEAQPSHPRSKPGVVFQPPTVSPSNKSPSVYQNDNKVPPVPPRQLTTPPLERGLAKSSPSQSPPSSAEPPIDSVHPVAKPPHDAAPPRVTDSAHAPSAVVLPVDTTPPTIAESTHAPSAMVLPTTTPPPVAESAHAPSAMVSPINTTPPPVSVSAQTPSTMVSPVDTTPPPVAELTHAPSALVFPVDTTPPPVESAHVPSAVVAPVYATPPPVVEPPHSSAKPLPAKPPQSLTPEPPTESPPFLLTPPPYESPRHVPVIQLSPMTLPALSPSSQMEPPSRPTPLSPSSPPANESTLHEPPLPAGAEPPRATSLPLAANPPDPLLPVAEPPQALTVAPPPELQPVLPSLSPKPLNETSMPPQLPPSVTLSPPQSVSPTALPLIPPSAPVASSPSQNASPPTPLFMPPIASSPPPQVLPLNASSPIPPLIPSPPTLALPPSSSLSPPFMVPPPAYSPPDLSTPPVPQNSSSLPPQMAPPIAMSPPSQLVVPPPDSPAIPSLPPSSSFSPPLMVPPPVDSPPYLPTLPTPAPQNASSLPPQMGPPLASSPPPLAVVPPPASPPTSVLPTPDFPPKSSFSPPLLVPPPMDPPVPQNASLSPPQMSPPLASSPPPQSVIPPPASPPTSVLPTPSLPPSSSISPPLTVPPPMDSPPDLPTSPPPVPQNASSLPPQIGPPYALSPPHLVSPPLPISPPSAEPPQVSSAPPPMKLPVTSPPSSSILPGAIPPRASSPPHLLSPPLASPPHEKGSNASVSPPMTVPSHDLLAPPPSELSYPFAPPPAMTRTAPVSPPPPSQRKVTQHGAPPPSITSPETPPPPRISSRAAPPFEQVKPESPPPIQQPVESPKHNTTSSRSNASEPHSPPLPAPAPRNKRDDNTAPQPVPPVQIPEQLSPANMSPRHGAPAAVSPLPSHQRIHAVPSAASPAPDAPPGNSEIPFVSPEIAPSGPSPKITKKPPSPPIRSLPPPPPNTDCGYLTCAEPTTNTPPGTPCGCVWPMQVGMRLSVPLYTFFPLVSELAKEIASGVFLKSNQVRVMGANATLQEAEKTIVLVDLIPLDGKFDNITSYVIFDRFWHKQVVIDKSVFGDYDVLFVRYPGLPPSPPLAPADSAVINGMPYSVGDPNGSKLHPLGVDITKQKPKHRLTAIIIAVIVLSAALGVLMCCSLAWILVFRHTNNNDQPSLTPRAVTSLARSSGPSGLSTGSGRSSPLSLGSSLATYTGSAKTFSGREMEKATDNFNPSRILGEGGFGLVYSGDLDNDTKVAVKVLKRDDQQGGREFLAEVEMLSRLHHRNLVKLIGICTDDRLRCLVYELIPNGSVDSHLHGPDKEIAPLDWASRLKIALGAARGLAYLHEDSSPRVIHRDFKSSNILLETDFTPKVSDFGLARSAMDEDNAHISTRVMGTFGYVAPEYAMTGHLLVKSDVYSYGVVLLELLTGRKPVDMSQPDGQENLVAWTRPLLTSREGLESIIDPSMGSEVPFESVAKVAAIASMCVQPEVSHRPFMGEVVQALKLVCNECDDSKDGDSRSHSRDNISVDFDAKTTSPVLGPPNPLQGQFSLPKYAPTHDAEKGLSVSEIFSASASLGRQASDSFRRNSASGPLRTARGRQFWQKIRGKSQGSASEHGIMYKL